MNQPSLFISMPRIETVVSSATSSRDGTQGTIYKLFVANPVNGSRVEYVNAVIVATQSITTNINTFRIFLTDATGANPILLREGIAPSVVIGPGQGGPGYSFNFQGGLFLGTNSALYVGQYVYTGINDRLSWVAYGGDL